MGMYLKYNITLTQTHTHTNTQTNKYINTQIKKIQLYIEIHIWNGEFNEATTVMTPRKSYNLHLFTQLSIEWNSMEIYY